MKQAERDSSHALWQNEYEALFKDRGDGTSTRIELDAENESITVQRVNNGDGSDVDDAGSINEKLSDVTGSDAAAHDVKLREISMCVQGTRKLAIVKCSEFYDPV